MSCYFFDSSALIKRYVNESGAEWVRIVVAPTAGHIILIARITPIEMISGAMRRKRDGLIDTRVAHAVRLIIDRHVQREYNVLDLTDRITQRAETLLETYPLRAYDAVQLASALESNARLVAAELSPLTFVSADKRLIDAALAESLAAIDPASL